MRPARPWPLKTVSLQAVSQARSTNMTGTLAHEGAIASAPLPKHARQKTNAWTSTPKVHRTAKAEPNALSKANPPAHMSAHVQAMGRISRHRSSNAQRPQTTHAHLIQGQAWQDEARTSHPKAKSAPQAPGRKTPNSNKSGAPEQKTLSS